jgi:hypothetical protein
MSEIFYDAEREREREKLKKKEVQLASSRVCVYVCVVRVEEEGSRV